VRYAFIKRHRKQYSVARLCRCLNVSRSGFYRWSRAAPNRYVEANKRLCKQVEAIHYANHEAYGTRRIKRVLQQQGHRISRHRVAAAKRLLGLYTQRRRRHELTRRSRQNRPRIDDRLQRNFRADAPNQVWVADITNVWTGQGWLQVAAVMDLYARRIVGWASGRTANDTLTVAALRDAIRRRRPKAGLIHHSDRGAAYTAGRYQQLLEQHGMLPSLSRPANCLDNAAMESFFSTLKNERTHHVKYRTRAEARQSVYDYIEHFYNPKRMHSTLGYYSPVQYEKYGNVA
jgi:putative transposase